MVDSFNIRPMLNVYPDSIGGNLNNLVNFLKCKELKNVFKALYILPSIYNSDLDRGFSVINYDLNKDMAKQADIDELKSLNIDLKLDFVLNHASVLSEQFQDILKKGSNSEYVDFFIRWNEFWKDYGEMCADGYIIPNKDYIKDMFFRKPGYPVLMVRMPNNIEEPYWNTFYQEIKYKQLYAQDIMHICALPYSIAIKIEKIIHEAIQNNIKPKEIDFGELKKYKDDIVTLLETQRLYLGQIDLNINSPKVWEFYDDTLKKLANYGAEIIRLDAFAYAPKAPGKKNFLNMPETWDLLNKIKKIADKYGLVILPEIHASYEDKIYNDLHKQGYITYDFFLPGLIIDAIETNSPEELAKWGKEIILNNIKTVNMLGCHDGIPVLDLKGILPQERIDNIIAVILERGGYIKNLHGQKNMYYQVNSTYYSALGKDDSKMLLARAIQIFMPGKPQVWYLDLLAGENDYEAVKLAGKDGHKEINRTNLSLNKAKGLLSGSIVKKQLELIHLRNTHEAFDKSAHIDIISEDDILQITWKTKNAKIKFRANFTDFSFVIE